MVRASSMGKIVSGQLSKMKESFLWAAAQRGRAGEVSELLELGADVNWANDSAGGETALLAAARNGHTAVAAALLAASPVQVQAQPSGPAGGRQHCNVNAVSASGMTALHHAARRGDVMLVGMLLDTGHCDAAATGWWRGACGW